MSTDSMAMICLVLSAFTWTVFNTAMLLERLAPTQGYRPPRPDQPNAPHGTYNGRPIIGSGARIDGGVYLGRKPREAIVVDSRGAQGQLARVYHDLVNRVHGEVEAGLGATAVSTSAFLREARRWFRTHLLTLLPPLVSLLPAGHRQTNRLLSERHY